MPTDLTAKEAEHSQAVKAMFSGIAARYDLLNHVLSLNIDKRWRRLVKRELGSVVNDAQATVLDVACGTGDLSVELQRDSPARVIGTDFCRPMLAVAAEKNSELGLNIPYVEADAMRMPVADNTFDAATIAFGLRNLPNFENGLKELLRILKPGGKLVVLECSHPPIPVFRQAYEFYFNALLPRIGGIVSGSRSAYQYLPNSVSKFPDQRSLAALMEKAGFTNVRWQNLTGGIAALHSGAKPI
jgi:demethylmenaquinone methyltransferase/2-methoxy-6-polyprenyl-1,4-benzoquinol methylase